MEKINFNDYYKKENDKSIRDEYHSMEELYCHRIMLFALICNQNKSVAWKSKKHEDNTMFDGMFIAGINTPEGQYSYHCKLEFWDLFNIKELNNAPHWDGHKPNDIGRLFSLNKNK